MPLSEYEQRVLDQLERDLGADPKLHRTMVRGPRRRGRIVLGVFGVLVGLGVVLAGVITQVVLLGIAGFALMLVAAMWVIFAPTHKATPRATQAPRQRGRKDPFMRRVEERLERRREQGDL